MGDNAWKSRGVDLKRRLKTSPIVTGGKAEYMGRVLWVEVVVKHGISLLIATIFSREIRDMVVN